MQINVNNSKKLRQAIERTKLHNQVKEQIILGCFLEIDKTCLEEFVDDLIKQIKKENLVIVDINTLFPGE